MAGVLTAFAQNTVHEGSPASFMHLHDYTTNQWVQPKYHPSQGYGIPNTTGIIGMTTTGDGSGYHTHAYVTSDIFVDGDDTISLSASECAACYIQNGTVRQDIMAPAWDGSGGYVDTVIQLGDRWHASYGSGGGQGNYAQSMTYTFRPDTVNPVLLVNYMLVMQDITHHDYSDNPKVEIIVTNQNGSLLNLQSYPGRTYYPNDYYTGYQYNSNTGSFAGTTVNGNFGSHGIWDANYNDNPDYVPNYDWPYSRYFYIAPGDGGGSHALLTPCFVEEDIFRTYRCPYSNQNSSCGDRSSPYDVVSFPYNVVAFNLTEQARNGDVVQLHVRKHGCDYEAHWAEVYFTAKMVPGKIDGNICNSDDTVSFEVPWGFKSYEWFRGLDADRKMPVSSGSLTYSFDRYNELVYPYYCCIMQSVTGVPFVYEANLTVYDLQAQVLYEQYAGDCAYNVHFLDSSIACQLMPKVVDNIPVGYDTTYLGTWSRMWLYKDTANTISLLDGGHPNDSQFDYTFPENVVVNGMVTIGLAIWDTNRTCYSDTTWVDVILDSSYVTPKFATDTIITCEESYTYDPERFGDLYTWSSPGTRPVIYEGGAWNDCDSTVEVTYIVQKPRVNAILTSNEYCDEFQTTLSVDASIDPVSYRWNYQYNNDTTFNDGVDPTAPMITINKPGTYTVTIADDLGCEATGEIIIDACKPFINLPNAITPSNMDGLNDCVELTQKDLLQTVEFSVYNRHGEMVFYTRDKNFCWDGRINDVLYTNVVYNWKLKIVDYNGIDSMYKGSIVVL